MTITVTISEVSSVKQMLNGPDVLLLDLVIDLEDDNGSTGTERLEHCFDPSDPYGPSGPIWPVVKEWLDANRGTFTVQPYTPPSGDEERLHFRALSPREFRDALIDNDILPNQVTAAIETIPDEKARAKALNAWEYPLEFIRTDPLIETIAQAFGLSPEQIDAMWREATG